MTISEHITTFNERPIFEVTPDNIQAIPDPASKALRIDVGYDKTRDAVIDQLEQLASQAWAATALTSLVIGHWDEMFDSSFDPIIDWLAANGNRLAALSGLFLGEVTFEECEISWIEQGDVTPLITSLPALRNLQVRGGNGLELTATSSDRLERLVIETGGLRAAVVNGITASSFPALGHLELWLGSGSYGADTSVDDLRPLLEKPPPALRHLGLRDADIANEIAAAIVGSPMLAQLEVLDLSMGTLTDSGAEALLEGGVADQVPLLDLSDNFLTDELVQRLAGLPTIQAADQKEPYQYGGEISYYTSVSE